MRKIVLVTLLLFVAIPSIAAVLSWTAPSMYTDGSSISTTNQGRITYTPYSGSSSSGPWMPGLTTVPGATTATMPDPAPGMTLWYTVDATLDGQTSAKAVPASKTVPFQTPEPPPGCTVK